MSANKYQVFISHGSADVWIATQIARLIQESGAVPFVHEMDSPRQGDFQPTLKQKIKTCDEVLVLFTPLSSERAWVWTEIGGAWILEKRITVVLYNRTISDFDTSPQGRAILDEGKIYKLNDLDEYLNDLVGRIKGVSNV